MFSAQLCSVILSIVGTVLMMAADGFGGGSVIGVLLALGAAIGAALYKVLFKRFLGDATYGQVSLFLTMLALLNLVLLWPIMLGLYYGKRETLDWNNLPWAFLCGTSALGIAALPHEVCRGPHVSSLSGEYGKMNPGLRSQPASWESSRDITGVMR
eukprot:XP_011677152.1 PREDICTED: putative thiamine transporter SLC35F3 [Strongylocentrotus purpuratus]